MWGCAALFVQVRHVWGERLFVWCDWKSKFVLFYIQLWCSCVLSSLLRYFCHLKSLTFLILLQNYWLLLCLNWSVHAAWFELQPVNCPFHIVWSLSDILVIVSDDDGRGVLVGFTPLLACGGGVTFMSWRFACCTVVFCQCAHVVVNFGVCYQFILCFIFSIAAILNYFLV